MNPRRCLVSLSLLLLVTALRLPAQAPAQDPADALLAKLSLEQKAGQLFVSWCLTRSDGQAEKRAQLLQWVRDVGLGGVILSLGSTEEAAAFVPQLQAAAKVPLLLAGDFEGGVAYRLTGATLMGNQMLVGATGSAELAMAMGEVTGAEAKALGFHWVFAPVLDVNSNPLNPIINVRSFGEDPAMVGRLGAAFAAGVRKQGLLSCGKHFPGHGDVDSDSHLLLPTVSGSAERLRAVEFLPFRMAAAEGLESVMTGHLAVPALAEDPHLPATLSPKILGDVLRKELGFTGLVVTDALEMGGVKNAFAPGEVAVRALLAGADVLLMPPDPLLARDAVVAAVQSGRVPMARLDGAVRAILQAKQKVGLLSGQGRVDPDWRAICGQPAFQRTAAKIANAGLTLVRDRDGDLPMHKGPSTLLLTLLDQDEAEADEELAARLAAELDAIEHRVVHPGSGEAALRAAAEAAGKAERVVLSLHVKVREFSGKIGLPPELRPCVAALRQEQQVIAVSFGNPYLVQQLPVADVWLCAYASSPQLQSSVGAALLGEAAITGRLPVGIPDVAKAGTGLSFYPGLELRTAEPINVGVAADLPAEVAALLQQAVKDQAFPGAVCVIARHGSVIAEVAVGHESYAAEAPVVALDTRYDLASLTKVCATTMSVLRLVAAGKLAFDDPVQKWLPEFVGTGKDRVTVRHLLAHCAGLPAYERYYRTVQGKAAIVAAAAKEGLMTEPATSTTYSDLGFVLLMAVVERASGEDFAVYARREVFGPLGMTSAAFAPTDEKPLAAPPTEEDASRGGLVRGFVHDENAYAMGGVSGHAGLFANAHDVLRIGLCLLGGGRSVLPRRLCEQARTPAGLTADRTRGLGLELLQAGGWAGTQVLPGAFGHTGFTGTSLWCDPASDTCVVLLSNRVHPTRVNNKITAVRRALHDLVRASVGR